MTDENTSENDGAQGRPAAAGSAAVADERIPMSVSDLVRALREMPPESIVYGPDPSRPITFVAACVEGVHLGS